MEKNFTAKMNAAKIDIFRRVCNHLRISFPVATIITSIAKTVIIINPFNIIAKKRIMSAIVNVVRGSNP